MLLDLLTTLTEKVRAAVAAGLEPGANAAPVELGAVSAAPVELGAAR